MKKGSGDCDHWASSKLRTKVILIILACFLNFSLSASTVTDLTLLVDLAGLQGRRQTGIILSYLRGGVGQHFQRAVGPYTSPWPNPWLLMQSFLQSSAFEYWLLLTLNPLDLQACNQALTVAFSPAIQLSKPWTGHWVPGRARSRDCLILGWCARFRGSTKVFLIYFTHLESCLGEEHLRLCLPAAETGVVSPRPGNSKVNKVQDNL